MFHYRMVKLMRSQAGKIDRPLREEMLYSYNFLKSVPCFLHNVIDRMITKRKKLPVIIGFHHDHCTEGLQEIEGLLHSHRRCKVKNHFTKAACCSAEVTPGALEDMLSRCSTIRKVYLNREVNALLDTAVPSANANNVEINGTSLTGQGITTAVIDTGVYPHQDLSDRMVDFVDFVNNREEPYDDNGHGTHCAGDAAGNGAASGGQYSGPAPESNIIGVKVLDNRGSGTLESIMLGIDWCMEYNQQDMDYSIDIISMSLGSPAQRYEEEEDDPMVQMVNAAWDQGILVCVAAGNEGPEPQTIASPGVSEKILTVGALDDNNTGSRDDDEVAGFSSRGPTIYGKTKPDLLAPGVDIVSLRSPNSYVDRTQKSSRVGDYYFTMSGTSMATPICAGVAALLLQNKPDASPQQIKEQLLNGSDLWRDRDPNIYGSGYINARNSLPK
ncbi:S8 family peptidase [Salibacterium aidingense]|uniref:S8 family peptidase n=1 Tax=Salibacterium aidingense TaxID=384933 RepID=UPI00047AA3A4|nr:S8 family peptidase [Salibacterium aidingense]